MLKYLTLILRIVVLGIIYIVLFRIIKIMYLDLKGIKLIKNDKEYDYDYALEVIDVPETLGLSKGSVFPVRDEISIGRKDNNTISVNDPYLSGFHAKVYTDEGRLFIRDLKSTNGTFKNGGSVKNIVEVFPGDTIEIGRMVFKVIG